MPTSGFSRNIWFLIPISRVLYQVPQTKVSSSNETKKRFYYKNLLAMIFNEIQCHANTSLGLVGGCIPCIPVSAPVLI